MLKRMFLAFVILLLYGTGLAQTERWVYRYDGPISDADIAYSILRGPDGNIYTAGYSWGLNSYADIIITSLTPTGTQRWIYRYDRVNDYDEAYSLVWGDDGNLYTAGFCDYLYGDFSILSVTPSGSPRWAYHYNGPANYADKANDIVYGADGNIYACGYSNGIGTGDDFTVVSLDTSGALRWVHRYNGAANSFDEARSIIYGNDGNIYVAGFTGDTSSWRDLTVISLTTNGAQRWIYTYDGTNNNFGEANSIVWGNDGNLYVAGASVNTGSGIDFTVLSITPAGSERWVYSNHGNAVGIDEALDLVYGADGNIYSAGYFNNSGTYGDITVVSLTNSGTQRWVYTRTNYSPEQANSLCYGGDGNIYLSGRAYQGSAGPDFTVISLTPTGNQRWIYYYNGPGNNYDDAMALVYGNDGNLYIAGASYGINTWTDLTVISLNPALGIEQTIENCKMKVENFSVYPNPAKTFFTVRAPLNTQGSMLRIFDVIGNIVKSEELKGKSNRISLDGITNGVYFVEVGNEINLKKLIITK